MKDDPCFRCPLPDCDEKSPRCVVRRLNAAYWSKMRHGRSAEVTPEERDANNRIFQSRHLELAALSAEGVRPYRRHGVRWNVNDGAEGNA